MPGRKRGNRARPNPAAVTPGAKKASRVPAAIASHVVVVGGAEERPPQPQREKRKRPARKKGEEEASPTSEAKRGPKETEKEQPQQEPKPDPAPGAKDQPAIAATDNTVVMEPSGNATPPTV